MPSLPPTFQARYPLSPRKFWKKLIEKILLGLVAIPFLSALLFIPVVLLIFKSGQTGDVVQAVAFSVSAVAVFWLFAMLFYAWYVHVYIRRYFYDANDSFVTIRKRVFAPAEIHVQYAKIQDVYVDQDIIDRLMGLYDVHLASATVASGMEAHIDGVDAETANGLKEFLLGKISGPGVPVSSVSSGALPPREAPVSFNREISTATYPVIGRWILEQAVYSIFTSLFAAIVLAFAIFSPGRGGSPPIANILGLHVSAYVLLAIFLVAYICHIIYAILWRKTFSFFFSSDYIVKKSGIIAKNETHVPYRSIQDVSVTQGIVERLFGLATVVIENAARSPAPARRMGAYAGSKNTIQIPGQPREKAGEISEALKQVVLGHSSQGTGL